MSCDEVPCKGTPIYSLFSLSNEHHLHGNFDYGKTVGCLDPLMEQPDELDASRFAQMSAKVFNLLHKHPMPTDVHVFLLSWRPQITKCQGLRADMGTLLALCNKTDNDIRSCINTLQVYIYIYTRL